MPKKLDAFTVQRTQTIRDAMVKITENKSRAVVVLNGKTVVGTVSDGDIRRALLKDILPMAPVDQIMNMNCRTTTQRDPAKVKALLKRERVTLLPIVNASNELLDIALAYEPFGDTPKTFPARR